MKRFISYIAIILLSGSLLSGTCRLAHAAETREQSLTVAFLYNFARYTEWPHTAELANSESFTFCFEAGASVEPFAARLATRKIKGKALKVTVLAEGDSHSDCQIMYFEKSSRRLARAAEGDIPILLVGRDLDGVDIRLFELRDTLQFIGLQLHIQNRV